MHGPSDDDAGAEALIRMSRSRLWGLWGCRGIPMVASLQFIPHRDGAGVGTVPTT